MKITTRRIIIIFGNTYKALPPETGWPLTNMPSIRTTHRSVLMTGSFEAWVTAVKFESISPIVKIPPSVVPVAWERESWKVMKVERDVLAWKTCLKKGVKAG